MTTFIITTIAIFLIIFIVIWLALADEGSLFYKIRNKFTTDELFRRHHLLSECLHSAAKENHLFNLKEDGKPSRKIFDFLTFVSYVGIFGKAVSYCAVEEKRLISDSHGGPNWHPQYPIIFASISSRNLMTTVKFFNANRKCIRKIKYTDINLAASEASEHIRNFRFFPNKYMQD